MGLNVFLVVFALLPSKPAFGRDIDTIKVAMEPSVGVDYLIAYTTPYTVRKDYTEYRGLPVCDTFQVGYAIINKYQYWLNEVNLRRKARESFTDNVRIFKIDTSQLSNVPIKSHVGIFSGLKNGKKIIIVDTDNDDNFSNETFYYFDTLKTVKSYSGDDLEFAPLVKVRYQTYQRNKIVDKYLYMRIKPYDKAYTHPDPIAQKLTVYTVPYVHKSGRFSIGDVTYKVALIHNSQKSIGDYRSGYLKIQKDGHEYEKGHPKSFVKPISVNGRYFQVLDCNSDGSELILNDLGILTKEFGGFVNDTIPVLKGVAFKNDSLTINDDFASGKYLLLDFWGSWCLPCLKAIDSLKYLYVSSNRERIEFIGVDFERNIHGKNRAIELVSTHGVSWPQISVVQSDGIGNTIPDLLEVSSFPTYILISPDGRVVAREIGEEGLKRISSFLDELKLAKKL